MPEPRDLLVEVGAEELPPKALRPMAEAFAREVSAGLEAHGLEIGEARVYATPRRIAVLVERVPVAQPNRESERRGPGLKIAFDEDGKPTKAAEGFARSVGVEVDQLEQLETAEGAWLVAPISRDVVFDVDHSEMWEHVVRSLGIEPATLVATRGVH